MAEGIPRVTSDTEWTPDPRVDQIVQFAQGNLSARAEASESRDQLVQQERLSALGEMAAGIAHDFGNELTAVTMYSRMGQLKLSSDDPMSDFFEEIQQASERAAGLTRQLMLFSSRRRFEPQVLVLNELILDVDQDASATHRRKHRIGRLTRLGLRTGGCGSRSNRASAGQPGC